MSHSLSSQVAFRMRVFAGVTIAFGLVVAAGAWPPIAEPARFYLDLVVWPLDGAPSSIEGVSARLFSAVTGGVMVGWGVTAWRLAGRASIISAFTAGVISWFVVDSTASILAGGWGNAIGNTGFLLLFVWVIAPTFARANKASAAA